MINTSHPWMAPSRLPSNIMLTPGRHYLMSMDWLNVSATATLFLNSGGSPLTIDMQNWVLPIAVIQVRWHAGKSTTRGYVMHIYIYSQHTGVHGHAT